MAAPAPSPERQSKPRALADIQYNSILANDTATSSEDESAETRSIAPAVATSLVGVSLGQAQTRLTLPQTPAAEKQAAIDEQGGFFGGLQIPDDAELDEESDKAPTPPAIDNASVDRLPRPVTRDGPPPATSQTAARLPSPWRAGPRKFKRTDESRAALKEGFHRRDSSGSPGPAPSSLETWRDAIKSSIHNFTTPFSAQQSSDTKTRPATRTRRSGSLFASFTSLSSSSSSLSTALPTRPRRNHSIANITNPPQPTNPPLHPPPPPRSVTSFVPNSQLSSLRPTTAATSVNQSEITLKPVSRVNSGRSGKSLRRSASESSLGTFRTLSRVPSLGDDSRFENISEQVNSRLKAIRDSWQDTNLRLPLPSLPSLSDISLNRSSSLSRKANGSNPRLHDTVSGTMSPINPREAKQNAQLAKAPTQGGFTGKTAQTHPQFTKALAELTGDVVVLGGYRGSILRSAEPPHRQLWAPIKVGLNVRKVDLEVGLNPEDDERATEKIIPGGMLTHIGPVDISRRLFKRLRASDNARSGKLRVHDYGYDWRLEPAFLSNQLIKFLEKLPCNRPGTPKEKRGATVIAHSLGGLITRHAVNQRPDLFAGVVYAGVPMTCVNILGPFRNGDDVLLSSRVLTAQVNFTIRTSFALLPLDGRCFFNKDTKEEYPVDFFDPQQWIDYRWSPCVARPLPSLTAPPPATGLAGIMNSMASVLPGRKNSVSTKTKQAVQHPASHAIDGLANPPEMNSSSAAGSSEKAEARGNIDYNGTDTMAYQMDGTTASKAVVPGDAHNDPGTSIATAVTIPRDQAIAYLTRILASVKQFKQNLDFRPAHAEQNAYPPTAVIYGKATPTVYGARVASREAIKHADAYDNLAFASGDGVVLAKAAMLPAGYQVARGGLVSSERGHVTLLGDLEAVGRCLRAVQSARRKGVGMGRQSMFEK